MKRLLFSTFILSLLGLGCNRTPPKTVDEYCVVTEVTYYRSGQRHTLQIDPEWKIKTSCGTAHTSRQPISVGDTIIHRVIRTK